MLPNEKIEPTGEELLKTAKTEAPPASEETTPPKAAPEETPPAKPASEETPKAAEPQERTIEEIEAEVNAFLGTGAKVPAPKLDTAPISAKSADGKTIRELVEEGRTDEAIMIGSQIVAKAERDKVLAELGASRAQQDQAEKRNNANRKVYLSHPELLDIDKGAKKADEVPFAKAIQQVYTEYPNLLETAEGPLMAMEIAEKRLGITKKVTDKTTQTARSEGADAEKTRQDATRAAAALASSSAGAPPPAAKEVNLSDSEKVVAGRLGMTEQDYGTMKGKRTVFGPAYYAKYRGGPKPKR